MDTMSTQDQTMTALALANHVRLSNCATLNEIRGMSRINALDTVIDILEDGDEKGPLGAVAIARLLKAIDRVGEDRARRILRTVGVMTHDRRLRQLTQRQRDAIAHQLRHPEILWPRTTMPTLQRPRPAA